MKSPDEKKQIESQIARICDQIARGFDILQKYHTDRAVKYGYCREKFEQLRDFHRQFPDCNVPGDIWPSLEKFEQFIDLKKRQIESEPVDISSGALIVSTSTAVSDIIALPLDLKPPSSVAEDSKIPPWWEPDKIEEYAQAFDKISHQLGSQLRAAWESYHSTIHDPGRGVLYHLRELFDQFFRAIAPDSEVQHSRFFKPKEPPKTNQIFRAERFEYAASKIKNQEMAAYLSSLIPNMVQLYEKLHILHKQGRIEIGHVRDTIIATAGLLFQWIEALENN